MLWLPQDVDGLSNYLQGLAKLDAELVEVCKPRLENGKYADAVRVAFLVLEKRMRESIGVEGLTGRELAQRAFGSGDGPLAKKMGVDNATANALRELYSGVFGVFRNPAAHQLDTVYQPDECREIISLVNLLLRQLERAQSKYGKVLEAIDRIVLANCPKEYALKRTSVSGPRNYYQVFLRDIKSHYELTFHERDHFLEVALHFEEKFDVSRALVGYFRRGRRLARLEEKLQYHIVAEDWGKTQTWARVYQRREWLEPEKTSPQVFADLLLKFIEVTHDEAKAATAAARKIAEAQKKVVHAGVQSKAETDAEAAE